MYSFMYGEPPEIYDWPENYYSHQYCPPYTPKRQSQVTYSGYGMGAPNWVPAMYEPGYNWQNFYGAAACPPDCNPGWIWP